MNQDTIVALSSPQGIGAIGVIRISGDKAINIGDKLFSPINSKKRLVEVKSHTAHYGLIKKNDNTIIDEVVLTLFKNPNSYTGEDTIEISCHGSTYIQQQIITLALHNGCRMATEGEFTLRAFINGKLDLSQAEAVADLIASDSATSHKVALQQMRQGYGTMLKSLRAELLDFASLITLELDFSEEDVDFVDNAKFKILIDTINNTFANLINSFSSGNAIKNGIAVSIIGKPNAGKSTLLNTLLNEEKAIVSEIEGTTRDIIEDQIVLDGIMYRFIDTAGLRKPNDQIENIGIQKAFEKMKKSSIIIYLFDATSTYPKDEINEIKHKFPNKHIILVANKIDKIKPNLDDTILSISAKNRENINSLKEQLKHIVNTHFISQQSHLMTNVRHLEALQQAQKAIQNIQKGIEENIPKDLLTIDINEALHYIGLITGQVTTDDLLGNIFSKFCIGK